MNNKYNDAKAAYKLKTVDLRTVDESVKNYFEKKIHLTVDSQDGPRVVPIQFATGERWSMSREKKGVRDKNGTLILPLVSIQRINIERNPSLAAMAQEVDHVTISSNPSPKNSILQQNYVNKQRQGLVVNVKPQVVQELTTVPFPDFCLMTYEVTFWSSYHNHMNEMLQKVFYSYDYADSFVIPIDYDGKNPRGRDSSRYFTAFREGDLPSESNYEEFTDAERIIKYSYIFKVSAWLILSPKDEVLAYGKQRDVNDETAGKYTVYQYQTTSELKLDEKVLDIEEFDKQAK